MKTKIIYKNFNLPTCNTWTSFHDVENPKAFIILINGSGEYRSVFEDDETDPEASWLNSNNYSVVKYDKYGCGESKGIWSTVTMNILRDQIVELTEKIMTEYDLPIILLGQSEGSILSVEVAEKCKFIKGLILKVPSHQEIKERLEFQLNKSDKTGRLFKKWIAGIHTIEKDISQGKEIKGFLSSHPKTYWASRLNRKLTGDILKNMDLPVFALNANEDYYTPIEAFSYIHDVLINHHSLSQAKIYKAVGHSLRNNGEDFGEAESDKDILAWLQKVI